MGIFPPDGDVGIIISSDELGKLAGFQFDAVFQSVVFPNQVFVAAKLLTLPNSKIKINIINNLFILNVYYIIKTTKKKQ